MWRLPAALVVACLVTLPGCGSAGEAPSAVSSRETQLHIVTTVAPITSIVAQVAGARAEVAGLVPEGTNSHTFEPPPRAARLLAQADVVFLNGLMLEDPIQQLAKANLKPGAEIVGLGDRAISPNEYIYDFSFPKEGGRPNPHLWTDPPLAKRYAEIVADVLARRNPASAAEYRANYEGFGRQADQLSEAIRLASGTIPPEKRQLLTYHDGFAYFARDFGWRVIGAIQPSSFDEPTPQEVANLIRQIRQAGVPAIFGSEVFPSPVLNQIGREAGVRYVDVLRDDDLPGEPGDPEHSWLGLMRFNFITMVRSLGGDASALEAVGLETEVKDRARYPQ